jgi:hypothetical protein
MTGGSSFGVAFLCSLAPGLRSAYLAARLYQRFRSSVGALAWLSVPVFSCSCSLVYTKNNI